MEPGPDLSHSPAGPLRNLARQAVILGSWTPHWLQMTLGAQKMGTGAGSGPGRAPGSLQSAPSPGPGGPWPELNGTVRCPCET